MYRKMIMDAKAKGLASETTMWESIDEVEDLLEELKESHPHKYWMFIRKTHGKLHKGHYDEEFAMHDVSKMEPIGMYWSIKQIEDVTKSLAFPAGVTKWDVFVGFNAFKNDLIEVANDEQILKLAYAFWFKDVDYPSPTKVWDYMCMVWGKKK